MLQDVATNASLDWLFVIFSAIDTLSRLPLLCEQVYGGYTIAKHLRKTICFFKLTYPQIEPAVPMSQDHKDFLSMHIQERNLTTVMYVVVFNLC